MCAMYYTGCSTPVPKIASIDQSAHEIEAQQSAKRNGIFREKQGEIVNIVAGGHATKLLARKDVYGKFKGAMVHDLGGG